MDTTPDTASTSAARTTFARARIAQILADRGLTQADLADMIEVRPPTVHKMLKGTGGILPATLEKVAKALGVPATYLTGQAAKLLGWVAAGKGEDEEAGEGEWVNLPDFCRNADGVYRVRGRSMIEVGILPGDYLAVRRNPAPASGELVVAWIRDCGAVVKRLKITGGRSYLHSEDGATDPRYPYLMADGDRFYGVLVASFRSYEKSPVETEAQPAPPAGKGRAKGARAKGK